MWNKEIGILLQKAKEQDADAFVELMQIHMKDMYRVALAILMNDEDVADAIQDTLLACWKKIGSLRQDRYFRTWMTRILINKCHDIQRNRKFYVNMEEWVEEPAAEDHYNLELKEALGLLDEKYRMVLTLFYLDGYSIADISKVLKIPKSTVQTRLQRGRKKLSEYYREE